MQSNSSKKLATLAVYSALALIVFAVESLFPSFFIPGAKMGLGNIFVLLALVTLGEWQAYVVLAVKCLLGCFVAGNFSTLLYSASAGIVSLTAMAFLCFVGGNKLSLLSISIVAAVLHNITQNAIYALVTQTIEVFAYLPYLLLLGIASGAIVGVASILILKNVPMRVWKGLKT